MRTSFLKRDSFKEESGTGQGITTEQKKNQSGKKRVEEKFRRLQSEYVDLLLMV